MKTIIVAALILCLGIGFSAQAQLVHCRQPICMVFYGYHDDRTSNPDMDSILALKPDILIDNTPGGFWGEINHGIGCLPLRYTPQGIKVFSYITGGYEGIRRGGDTARLDSNLVRIDRIANDSATGVFLDEVSSHPDSAGKNYITVIFNRCVSRGLKLILNPGTPYFDPWLMSHCNFIMTDEDYHGRAPLGSEFAYLDSVLVVKQHVTSPTAAATFADSAQAYHFGYNYSCDQYIYLPTWLRTYSALITNPPVASFINTGASAARNFNYTGTTTSVDSVVFNFGDGIRTTGMVATHTYATADTYTVCATAYSSCGTDSSCQTIIVPCNIPVASFTHSGTSTIHFSYTGTTAFVDSIMWFLGDGSTGSGTAITHAYSMAGTYRVCLIAYSACANDTACVYVTIAGLSVNNTALEEIILFPNPAADQLTIEHAANCHLDIYDVIGRKMYSATLKTEKETINIQNLPKGIYTVNITDNSSGEKIVRKVIKE